MAAVNIHTGEIPSATGKDGYQLAQVIARWQSIAHGEFPENCKALLQMLDETDRFRLWEKNVGGFTFESREEFLRKKVLIDFDFTEQSLSEIVTRLHRGEEVRLPLRQNGGDRRSDEFIQSRNHETEPVSKSDTKAYVVARLDRDAPELACAVREGRMSANAAAIEAGFRRKPTPLETAMRAWGKMSDEERSAFCDFLRGEGAPMNPKASQYQIVVGPLPEKDGGGFIATVPDLPGCMSDGETPEEAVRNALDAITCWIEAARDRGRPVPEPSPLAPPFAMAG